MATKAALLTLVAAQLPSHIDRVGIERVTDGTINTMVENAFRIETAIDQRLPLAKKETK